MSHYASKAWNQQVVSGMPAAMPEARVTADYHESSGRLELLEVTWATPPGTEQLVAVLHELLGSGRPPGRPAKEANPNATTGERRQAITSVPQNPAETLRMHTGGF